MTLQTGVQAAVIDVPVLDASDRVFVTIFIKEFLVIFTKHGISKTVIEPWSMCNL